MSDGKGEDAEVEMIEQTKKATELEMREITVLVESTSNGAMVSA